LDYVFLSVLEKIVEKRGKKTGKPHIWGGFFKFCQDVLQKSQLNIIHPSLAKPPYLTQKIGKAQPLVATKIRQDFLDPSQQPIRLIAQTLRIPSDQTANVIRLSGTMR